MAGKPTSAPGDFRFARYAKSHSSKMKNRLRAIP